MIDERLSNGWECYLRPACTLTSTEDDNHLVCIPDTTSRKRFENYWRDQASLGNPIKNYFTSIYAINLHAATITTSAQPYP